jgi:hypothetical protein
MSIVFVHGVAVRDQASWPGLERFLRHHIAPKISEAPEAVTILPAWWYKHGANFRWNGAARPRTPLLGQGASVAPAPTERAIAAAEAAQSASGLPSGAAQDDKGGFVAGGPSKKTSPRVPIRLKDLQPEELSDIAATVLLDETTTSDQRAIAAIAADEVAHSQAFLQRLAQATNFQEELEAFQRMVGDRYIELSASEFKAQGFAPGWIQDFRDHLGEALGRANDTPGFLTARLFAEFRRPLNDFITLFFGDVFTYLDERGTAEAPGQIVTTVLDTLSAAKKANPDEPLVVLSHSMGGQIVYDLVTRFLPQIPRFKDLRIDFWCATASQVGLFEELKLFLASKDQYGIDMAEKQVPYPDRRNLGVWWNVWDPNDFLSYTARDIVAGLSDESYNSGMSLLKAHGGYLERPSFFRELGKRVQNAKDNNWR